MLVSGLLLSACCCVCCCCQDRPEHGISKRSYMAAVLAGIQQARQAQPAAGMLVKLLLSIDRRNDAAAAMDTVGGPCPLSKGFWGL